MRVTTAKALVSDWSRNKATTGRVSRQWRLRTTAEQWDTVTPFTRRTALRLLGQVVYAIRTPDGCIKIGSTNDLDHRLRKYKAEIGEHELLCFQHGELADERALHDRFRPNRAHGREWYHPAPEILDWINEIRPTLGLQPVA